MSIACDARALIGPSTGIGTWTTQIAGGLARGGNEKVLLAASKHIDLPPALRHEQIEVLPTPALPVPGTVWLHTTLPRQLQASGARVWIASLAIVPRRCPIPAVAVVQDLTPRTHPHRHTLANRFCFNAYLEESLESASAVVAASKATHELLGATFPWIEPRLHLIPNGVDPYFSPPPEGDDGSRARRSFSRERPYLLYLGTLEPRKGIITLIDAWERLRLRGDSPAEGLALVLAGKPGWETGPLLRRIASSPFAEDIHRPGYVSRSDARDLLRHAAVFVLASEAEGYGLPLAEALSCGTPAVASDIPPLREVAGDAALLTPVGDAAALADAISAALEPNGARRLRCRALVRARSLRWEPAVSAWQRLLAQSSIDAG